MLNQYNPLESRWEPLIIIMGVTESMNPPQRICNIAKPIFNQIMIFLSKLAFKYVISYFISTQWIFKAKSKIIGGYYL